MTKLHASTHAATKALADLKSLHSLARDNRDKLRAFQQRHATAEAPAWLDMALAAVWPEAPASSGRDLLKAMLVVGGEYVEWKDDSGTPVRWFADHPDDHLCRVGATTLSALGRSEGIKIEPLPGESVHSAYARSTRMSLEWLHDATQAQVAMVNPAVPRWGLPPSCRTLGTPAQVGVLLAAGPNKGALAALRLQAVHSRGAQLTLAPVPASICLLLDAEFGQMLEDLRALPSAPAPEPAGSTPAERHCLGLGPGPRRRRTAAPGRRQRRLRRCRFCMRGLCRCWPPTRHPNCAPT
jgi:hypothetical protein